MKKFSILIIVVIVFLVIQGGTNTQAGQRIYGFKSAEIELKVSGPMMNGTHFVKIADWGQLEARKEKTIVKVFGFEKVQEQVTYIDRNEGVMYNYDPTKNQATKMDMKKMADAIQKNNMYEYNDAAIKEWGGEKNGTADVNGLKCDVVKFPKLMSTVYFHKKYPVKSISNAGGMEIITEVVSFKENVSFSKDELTVPSDAKIVDAPDIENVMSQMNAYKNDPEYQEQMKNRRIKDYRDSPPEDFDPAEMPDINKALQEAGPEMEKAMQSLQGLFGN